jgi:hypothetical protein
MATIKRKNFPGVYSQIIDQSFFTTNTARFRPGLIGAASKGPMNTPTQVRTNQDFVRIFGQPLDGDFFLATAVGVMTPFTDGTMVVRVGLQYQNLPAGSVAYTVTGTSGASTFTTAAAPLLSPGQSPTGVMYVQITQDGKKSLINAKVLSGSGTTVTLDSDTLPDTYTTGTVKYSYYADPASKSQGSLEGYTYTAISTLGTVTGVKGNFYFAVTSNPTDLAVGDLLRISQAGFYPTFEAYVKKINPIIGGTATIELQATDDTEHGYVAVSLQDSYTAATVERVSSKATVALIYAASEGTWANTAAGSETAPITGLQVKIEPGTMAGTKRILIYWDSALVEVYDNLAMLTSYTFPTGALDFETAINTTTPSNYITIKMLGTNVPANSVDPWNTAITDTNFPAVPQSPTNTARPGDPLPGGAFDSGFNGEAAQAVDFIGVYNPVDDTMTGLKAFEDTDNVDISIICAPGITSTDATYLGVHTQMRDTALVTKSIGLIDVPKTVNGVPLNVWNAIDWHNGQGRFSSRGKLDTAYLACFWNWFTMQDPFTQETKVVPPTIGVLRAMAFTWFHDQPWYAAAGEKRGVLDIATAVMFPRLSDDAKEAMYGSGNSINPIIQRSGSIMVWGERTLQRRESKLTAIHNLVLVEYVVKGLSVIGRKYVFDPNDLTLLTQLRLDMTQFLDSVKNLRGIEAYNLVCDDSNNNSSTRNRREVIVDLYVIPTDAVERIYINATVRESGADLNNITG